MKRKPGHEDARAFHHVMDGDEPGEVKKTKQPDIDICQGCKEHAEFSCCIEQEYTGKCAEDCDGELTSNCCGEPPYAPE